MSVSQNQIKNIRPITPQSISRKGLAFGTLSQEVCCYNCVTFMVPFVRLGVGLSTPEPIKVSVKFSFLKNIHLSLIPTDVGFLYT